jgi:hypothetical protein
MEWRPVSAFSCFLISITLVLLFFGSTGVWLWTWETLDQRQQLLGILVMVATGVGGVIGHIATLFLTLRERDRTR